MSAEEVNRVLDLFPVLSPNEIRVDILFSGSAQNTIMRILDNGNSLPNISNDLPTPKEIVMNDALETRAVSHLSSPLFSPMNIDGSPMQIGVNHQAGECIDLIGDDSPVKPELIQLDFSDEEEMDLKSPSKPARYSIGGSNTSFDIDDFLSLGPASMRNKVQKTRELRATNPNYLANHPALVSLVENDSDINTNIIQTTSPSMLESDENVHHRPTTPRVNPQPTQNLSEVVVQEIKKPKTAQAFFTEIVVVLDSALTSQAQNPAHPSLTNIHKYLADNQRYVFSMFTKQQDLPQVVEWKYKERIKFPKDQDEVLVELTNASISSFEVAKFTVIVIMADELFQMVKGNTLTDFCKRAITLYAGKQISLLLVGTNRWSKCNAGKMQDTEAMEDAIIWLQFESSCFVHHSETALSAANFIQLFTESIIESKYKSTSKFDRFCAEAVGKKTSADPFHVWVEQLKQIKGISDAKANAIALMYPTIQSLALAYGKVDVSVEEKKALLEKLPIPNRPGKTVGIALSRKVHQLFTEERADTPLL